MGEAARASRNSELSDLLATLVAVDGTQGHAYACQPHPSLLTGSLANLADAAHYLCLLHGRHPGVIDHAAARTTENAARLWLIQAADAFSAERAFLTQLSVALGPAPSTAGQDECETTVLQQRHALDMLAQSDRRGCAMGAALALVLDWGTIRHLLDIAAIRVGLEPRPMLLPEESATRAVADALADGDDALIRAVQFGASQMLRQHRGMWDLLQARTALRAGD